ncbi:glutamine synthetase, partial [Tannerella forsythia]
MTGRMKMWAKELGGTHYTRWFRPLTEGTAQKDVSFIDWVDGAGGSITGEFSGELLAQQERAGSSFPSGGIRSRFEARGYTAWDPLSPAFSLDDTLCIPTIFISCFGEATYLQAPLWKAIYAIITVATDACHYFDLNLKTELSYLGWQ